MNINIDTVAFDADTADVDALRVQIKSLAIDLRQAQQDLRATSDDASTGASIITDLIAKFGMESAVRELCTEDAHYSEFVRSHGVMDLSRDYEIRVTVPVAMTIIVSGDNEDDALENIAEHLSNEVRVDVHGVEDYDFDSYDFHIDGISEA